MKQVLLVEGFFGQSSYEFRGRLINVLHFREAGKPVLTIVHIPRRESPYYLQINNGEFSEPKKYKGIEITKLYYVSRITSPTLRQADPRMLICI